MTAEFPDIIVVGSANADLVVTAPRIPKPGETVLGNEFTTIAGGKGANQAVAAARLGKKVGFVGRVGDDAFAQTLRDNITRAGVDDQYLQTSAGAATGVALIVVSEAGENAITVAPGANALVTPDDVRNAEPLFTRARVCLLQMEIPRDTVLAAIALARTHGVEVILDPAPAPRDPPPELFQVDVLTPNQSEAAELLRTTPAAAPEQIAAALHARGSEVVILKAGAAGALVLAAGHATPIASFPVDVVDTTAAGDAFTAGLAVARAEGADWTAATRFACAAGALACTRHGAQTSLPTRSAVEALLSRHAE